MVFSAGFSKGHLRTFIMPNIKTITIVFITLFSGLFLLNVVPGEKKVKYMLEPQYEIGSAQFIRSMGHLLGPVLVEGNQVTELENGDQIFPAMLKAISEAKRSITFETYIYWSGNVGERFSHALSERARSGIKVHVLLDWVGCGKMDKKSLEEMRKAGVQVEYYRPLRWYHLARLNNRTHRKILVVDGKIGFTGGVGIADKWDGHAQDRDHWRDIHFQAEGPVVAQMQAIFMDNWMKTKGIVLDGEDYFPPLQFKGDIMAQVFKSSSREGSESVRLMYLMSIAAAKKTLRFSNSYFVPDNLAIETLIAAQKRGVKIEIILPGKDSDSQITRLVSRSLWEKMLKSGIDIYEYKPTMYHCKVMIVDDAWVSVGSTNFDNRSFRLNDEANLNLLDADFAANQIRIFEQDKAHSKQVTMKEWKRRPWTEKILENLSRLLRYQV